MKDWYKVKKDDVFKSFDTSKDGISQSEADARLEKYGKNMLEEAKKKTFIEVFLGQFADLLVIILIIAAIISAITGEAESTIVIIAVLILNAVLGTIQHFKAEKSLAALKSLSSPSAKVIRDGKKIEIDSIYVVPGDILLLEAGDMVVADGRIIENFSLQINESSLTGESTNVDKKDIEITEDTALADRINMVYSGSLVTYGRAYVLVTGTGMNTEIGKIAELMNKTKEKKTPLQVSLDQFSKKLAISIMIICLIVFGLSIMRNMHIMDALLFAVALAVAAIPEALSSIVTIVQAMGTQKMAAEQAIIKNLAAVESLGCVSVICSDKTGTLTQNKMTVQDIYVNGEITNAEGLDLKCRPHRYLLYDAVLANDSSIIDGKGIGDPTEYALLEMFRKIDDLNQGDDFILTDDDLRGILKRIEEVPFDSDRKLMSTKHLIHGVPTVFTKGALDVLLDRCDNILIGEEPRPITDKDKEDILAANNTFSEQGLRVLAFAYKETDEKLTVETEYGYTFIGLVSEIDPPREESIQAVADAKSAGIRTVMITGDHKVTATAIARKIGIFEEGDIAVTGQELDAMTDEELDKVIEKISVYARVSPENKIRIVDAWQRKGKVVSMTGDGVNDAPALKKADIGVAMGITGTEVSKDAASMILADDNFATIIKAVANGRTVFTNIKNAVLYLISGNFSAIIVVIFASLAALPIPFQAVQLLFINLVTDSLPALAIGVEPGEYDVLKKKPRDPSAGIMDKNFVKRVGLQGGLIAICVICSYLIGLTLGAAQASTMAFSTLTLARLLHGFNCRSEHSLAKIGFKRNRASLNAFLLGLLLVICVLCIPVVMSMFSVSALTIDKYLWIALFACIPTIIIQVIRMIKERG
jgi:Ca2+-transporting ATPase